MRRSAHATALGLLLVLVFRVLPTVPSAAEVNRTFVESFPANGETVLHLNHGDGDVTITPWEKNEVEIEVVYRGEVRKVGIGTARTDFDVEFKHDGPDIRVKGKEVGKGMMFGYVSHEDHEYRYTVRAPDYVTLELNGDDGDVVVEAWRRSIHCSLGDGNLLLKNIVADQVKVTTTDGDVRVQESTGRISILTTEGNVEVFGTRSSALDIKSTGGNVQVDLLPSIDPTIDIRTGDGRVRLALGLGTSAVFDLGTAAGNIRLDLSRDASLEESRNHVKGSLNGGRGSVRVRTTDGSIILKETTVVM